MSRYIIIYLLVGVLYVVTYTYLVLNFPRSRPAKRRLANKKELVVKYGRLMTNAKLTAGIVIGSIVGGVIWPISLLIDILPSRLDKE